MSEMALGLGSGTRPAMDLWVVSFGSGGGLGTCARPEPSQRMSSSTMSPNGAFGKPVAWAAIMGGLCRALDRVERIAKLHICSFRASSHNNHFRGFSLLEYMTHRRGTHARPPGAPLTPGCCSLYGTFRVQRVVCFQTRMGQQSGVAAPRCVLNLFWLGLQSAFGRQGGRADRMPAKGGSGGSPAHADSSGGTSANVWSLRACSRWKRGEGR